MAQTNNLIFKLIEQNNDSHAVIKFSSLFAGEKICWQATIMTLNYYQNLANEHQTQKKQFIEIPIKKIAHASHSERSKALEVKLITVVLKVSKIDTATLTKTVIMLRQYKNLEIGLHEFG